jgi:hypothetical protein
LDLETLPIDYMIGAFQSIPPNKEEDNMSSQDLIREIRQGKQNLELEIANIISNYEKRTGVVVTSIDINKILSMGSIVDGINIIKIQVNI